MTIQSIQPPANLSNATNAASAAADCVYGQTRAWSLACLALENEHRPTGKMAFELEQLISELKIRRLSLLKSYHQAHEGSKRTRSNELPALDQELQIIVPVLRKARVLLEAIKVGHSGCSISHIADFLLGVVVQTKQSHLYDGGAAPNSRYRAHHIQRFTSASIDVAKSMIEKHPGLFAHLPAMFTLAERLSLNSLIREKEVKSMTLEKATLRNRILAEMTLSTEEKNLLARFL